MTITSFARNTLFLEKLDAANSEIDATIRLPLVGKDVDLSFGNPMLWIQLQYLMLIESAINLTIAALVYYFIVKRRGTTGSFLVGYGLICPALIALPFCIIKWADLRSPVLFVASAASPCLLFFRCLEAMYGTAPAFAEKGIGSFLLYYCATVQFEINPKTEEVVKLTMGSLLRKSGIFLALFAQVGILNSVLLHYQFSPFPAKEINVWADLFFWGNLANNYIMAFYTSISLEVGSTGVGILTSLCSGNDTVQLNFKPLSASSSPSDFWGQRWNRLVSSGLKRGVFKPMRKAGFGRPVAALATFVASGLLHEYILIVMIFPTLLETKVFPLYGTHLAFFAWNGVVLILEPFLAPTPFIQWISRTSPAGVKSFLVVMTVLPVAHLFTKEYVDNGFFEAFSIGLPRLYLVDST